MRWALLAAGLMIGLGCGKRPAPDLQSVDTETNSQHRLPTARTEQGLAAPIQIKGQVVDFPPIRSADGKELITGRLNFTHLSYGDLKRDSQISNVTPHFCDDFSILGSIQLPWNVIAVTAALHSYDPRQEPLLYYHRSGPVGAIFNQVRTRNNGKDANAPVALIGLSGGAIASYFGKGQRLTVYEPDPTVKQLVADTDTYFTFIRDARKRGAEVNVRIGDVRTNLKDDQGQRYALLLVNPFNSDQSPNSLLTKEAVQLYLDRIADDGIVAINVTDNEINFEPMVSSIARELKLTGRIWKDVIGRPAKMVSSWVVLARKPEDLANLYNSAADALFPSKTDPGEDEREHLAPTVQFFEVLAANFDELRVESNGKPKYQEMNEPINSRKVWLNWIESRLAKATEPKEKALLERYAYLMRNYPLSTSFYRLLVFEYGHAFRRLETRHDVPAWTDSNTTIVPGMKK